MTVIINDKETATTTIPFIPVPAQIIRIGAKAVFGKAFNTTKNGSHILVNVLENHNIIANNIPKKVPIIKPNKVSYNEIPIWINISFETI